ncbi:MAG: hypothetical protein ACQERX_01150 [Bacillota bacterium]
MKKIFILFLAVFGMFGIISCSGDDTQNTVEEINLDEQADIPTNLAITNTTLTWSEVEGVSDYRVYANGEIAADVTTNSFDFSDIEGDKIIFTVRAMAPSGMQNSNMSVTIAYVANRAQEVSGVKTVLSENNMDLFDSDGFAEELVNKGMTASEFGSMMNEYNLLMDEMVDSGTIDLSKIYDAISSFMDSMDRNQIEAFISPFIKFELRTQIEAAIADYEQKEDNYGYNYQETIQMNQNILDFLDDNVDEVIRSAMIVVDYIMEVETGISNELVGSFETIFEASSPDQVNIDLAVTVKNELINNLKDSIPELEDVVILNYTIVAFMSTLSDEVVNSEEMNITKQTAQSLITIELLYNYVLAIDSSYINGLLDATQKTEYDMAEDIVILNLTLLDEFLEDNQTLIEQMDDIYSAEEKEEMFFDYQVMAYANQIIMQSPDLNESDIPVIKTIMENNIDFNDVLTIQTVMDENFNAVLDALITSDFEVIKKAFDIASLDYDDFDDYYSYYRTLDELTYEMQNEFVNLINPILQDMTVTEYQALIDLGFGYFIIQLETMNLTDDIYDIEAYESIKAALDDTVGNQLGLLKLILAELDDEDLLLTISDLSTTNTEESAYELFIIIANSYISVYDNGGQGHLDAITAEIIATISDPDNMVEFNLTQTKVDEISSKLGTYFEDIYTQADVIKDYDSANLTNAEIIEIEDFIAQFGELYF